MTVFSPFISNCGNNNNIDFALRKTAIGQHTRLLQLNDYTI